ncbi:hypothetical protein ACHAXA_002682 [Cyclostephanos tholiformis]|uniref:DUF7495 domain-containing protein n=1 Tax=Cyclostephanos tholiformis TaxID=382380 RepID=A0ABD3S011_9STRA
MRNSEEALELASEVESEVRDQDHFAGGHVVGIDVPPPSSPPPTLRPTVQIDAPEPMWYSTTHRHYQEILKSTGGGGSMSNGNNNNNLTNSDDANLRHVVAEAFCSHVAGMRLCDYASYCPDGRGSEPYGGGPPIADNATNHGRKRIAQWAPFLLPDDDSVLGGYGGGEDGGGGRATLFGDDVPHWVQVGGVPSDMGGNDENHYASCWTYADWNDEMGGGNGGNIEGVWEGHHRLWMLCCPL